MRAYLSHEMVREEARDIVVVCHIHSRFLTTIDSPRMRYLSHPKNSLDRYLTRVPWEAVQLHQSLVLLESVYSNLV